jgi:hypothetical protein
VSTDQNDQIKSKLFSRFITFVLIALCCLFLLPACDTDPGYSSGKELRGVIVNADTGEPIPDAIVVAKWITSTGTAGGSELVCFHVGTATTNSAGEYYMPAWRQKSPFSAKYERDITVYAYKPGYRAQYRFPPREGYITEYIKDKLVPSQETAKERLEYLDHLGRNTLCFQARESVGALLPLQEALLDEARSLAESESDPVVQYLQDKVAHTETKLAEIHDPSKRLNETLKSP